MTHHPNSKSIPTWTGQVSLRWHTALVAGMVIGFIVASFFGEVL